MVHGQDEDAGCTADTSPWDTTITMYDLSSAMGTTPTTNGTNSQGTVSQEAKRPS